MSACLTFIEWTGNIQVTHTNHTPDCQCRNRERQAA